MASVDVTVNFTYRNITAGRITATPLENYIDKDGKLVAGGIPFPSVLITGGTGSIIVPSTKDYGIGIKFVIESGTSPNYTLVDEFVAVIDNTTPLNGNALLQNFFSQDLLDTSIYSISDMLTKAPFLDRLSARIPGFVYKPYTASTTFVKNDITFRGERLYQWIKNTSGTNVDPLTAGNYTDPGNLLDGTINADASWQVVTSSLKGTGTTTTDVDYNNTTFLPLTTQPASRENLAQLDNLLRASIIPDLTPYAKKDSPDPQIFASAITVPDLVTTDNSTKVTNSKTVRNIINSIAAFGDLRNRLSIVEERYTEGSNVSLNTGVNIRQLNTIHRNNGDVLSLTNAVVTVKSGTYLLVASAVANRCSGSKIYLFDENAQISFTTRSMSSYTGENLANVNQSHNAETFLIDFLTFTFDAVLSLRQTVGYGRSTAGGVAANQAGFSELFSRIVFFRLF